MWRVSRERAARRDPMVLGRRLAYGGGVDFGTLALIVAAGLLGPLLAAPHNFGPLLVVGELAAGAVIGRSGFGWVDPSDPATALLSQVGFAVLMLIAGTHLPLRTPQLRGALASGVLATVVVAVLAVPVALLLASVTPVDHVALLMLLLIASSAAVVMPTLAAAGPADGLALRAIAWVVVADVATIVAVPVVTASGNGWKVIGASIAVVAAGLVLFAVIARVVRYRLAGSTVDLDLRRGWGLRLRLSLLALFALAWLAQRLGTSVLLAGFTIGAILAALGEPRTLAQELIGVGEGFLVPLFFVILGATIQVDRLFDDAGNVALMLILLAGTGVVHVVAAMVLRLGWTSGLVASAQLGVPSAVVSLGLANRTLRPGEGAAIMAAAVGTVGLSAIGAIRLRAEQRRARRGRNRGAAGRGAAHRDVGWMDGPR